MGGLSTFRKRDKGKGEQKPHLKKEGEEQTSASALLALNPKGRRKGSRTMKRMGGGGGEKEIANRCQRLIPTASRRQKEKGYFI